MSIPSYIALVGIFSMFLHGLKVDMETPLIQAIKHPKWSVFGPN